MELNLTHEESKKILGLGYDFSRVCQNTYFRYEDLSKGGKYYRNHVHGLDTCLEFVLRRIRHLLKDTYEVFLESEGVTPIIPKAALEKCLLIDFPPESEHDYRHFEKCCGDDVIELEGRSKSIKFNSAFEAFLWCHENYPKELRAKFEEVMK